MTVVKQFIESHNYVDYSDFGLVAPTLTELYMAGLVWQAMLCSM